MPTSASEIVEIPNTVDTGDNHSPEVESRPSVREAVEAAYEKVVVGREEAEADEPAETPAEKTARERDEAGRFVAKAKELKDHEAHKSGAEPTIESQPAQAIESAPSAIPVPVPAGWAADVAPLFNQAPPRLQQEIHRRETDLRRGLQQATEKAAQVERTWAEVDQELAPYKEAFARNGVTPARVVSQLMSWQRHLDANPEQALEDLARTYGLDLRQVAESRAQQPQEPPHIRELRQQVQQLTGLFNQQTEAQKQAQQQQAQQAILADIQAFANETDASGNPVRPYVEHVIDDMLPIMTALRGTMPTRQLLQTAYEKAVWMNPSTRELELKKVTAPPPNTQNIEKARKAAKLVNGEAIGNAPPERPKTVRAAAEAAWEKLHP